jgi:lysophospholipase L1-like esterase
LKKRLISLCMVLVLCLSLLPVTVLAANNSYVALGDSITAGYGLGGEQSFAEIVAKENGYTLNDTLATDGATSEELLDDVTAPANADTLKNTDLITITIGGNDLMNALYEYLAAKSGQDVDTIKAMLTGGTADIAALGQLIPLLSGFADSNEAKAALSTFTVNLTAIVGAIKQANPDVILLVTTQYNPYSYLAKAYGSIVTQAQTISDAFDQGVSALNAAIRLAVGSNGTVVDVYDAFEDAVAENQNPCNPSALPLNLDFHPNAYGHELIAAAIADKLPEMPEPEPEPDPEVEPNIYVGGVRLYGDENTTAYAQTDENGQVTTQGATASNYNISWNGETLTLNNANIQGGYTFDEWLGSAAIYYTSDLKIELAAHSTNRVSTEGETDEDVSMYSASMGVYSTGNIAISGDGALTITAVGQFGKGIEAGGYGGVIISGGTVTVASTYTGINGNIVIVPPTDKAIKVEMGATKDSALEIQGSPFRREQSIEGYNSPYFHSEVVDSTEGPDANLYVGGVGLYGDKESQTIAYANTLNGIVTTTGADEENYNVKWDGETLTLKNADIQNRYTFTKSGDQVSIYSEKTFTVELIGTNTLAIVGEENRYVYCIRAEKDIAFSGKGTLEIAVSGGTASYGLISDNTTISGGSSLTIDDTGAISNGAYIGGSLTISDGSALISAVTGGFDGAIDVVGNIVISGGSKLTGESAGEKGINVDGSLTVLDGSEVTATASGEKACGIYVGSSMTVTNSTVHSIGGSSGLIVDGILTVNDRQEAIRPDAEVWISMDGTVTWSGQYPFWVGGTQVNDENADNVLGDGTVSYDIGTNTLTLRNATITQGTHEESAIYSNGNLNIVLEGENTVNAVDIGIYVYGTLAISGSGSLTVNGINIENGDIIISSGTVTTSSTYGGIMADNVTISGGTVTATGEVVGITVYENVTINGGEVTATGEMVGITAYEDVTINGGEVTATGDEVGIQTYINDITISGGTVTARGSDAGITADENVTINGGEVTATGDTMGIKSDNNVTVSGGTVTAMGGTMGIYAGDSVTISPKSSQQIAVTSGMDKDSATAIYGSPFRGETDIRDLIDEAAYFHSETSARPNSGGGGGGSGNNTETEKNPDGSTTTTVTKPDGSTTETTKWPDGSKEVVETKKDGTVTTTTTDKDGNQIEVVENPDGSSKTTVDNKDGSSFITTVDEDGKVEAEVKLPADLVEDAQEKGEAVTLPMPEVPVTTDRDEAPTITVDLPSGTAVQVEIPVKRVTSGTVAMLVKDNGTEEVIKTSLTTENGVAVTLSDGDTVKIVDNSKTFTDVPGSYWGSEYIDFVTSREIFSGTGGNTFSPDASMTRGMIVTVLAAYDGADTSSNGGAWYEAGRQWAMANGISDGTNMDSALTREQLAVMLWNYAGKPAAGSLSGYTDAASVSDWAVQAMAWCVEQGIISGMDGGLNPQGTATRAQVATMLMQFCQLGK